MRDSSRRSPPAPTLCSGGIPNARSSRSIRLLRKISLPFPAVSLRCLRSGLYVSNHSRCRRGKKVGPSSRHGGAGFPTHCKWVIVAAHLCADKIVVRNDNEDEPGTSKYRHLVEHTPHQVIEGALVAGVATRSNHVILYAGEGVFAR